MGSPLAKPKRQDPTRLPYLQTTQEEEHSGSNGRKVSELRPHCSQMMTAAHMALLPGVVCPLWPTAPAPLQPGVHPMGFCHLLPACLHHLL